MEIAISIDPAVVRAATLERETSARWLTLLKRTLRPAKAVVAPIVARALPAIGRAAIRARRE